jgi:hypothetical protein
MPLSLRGVSSIDPTMNQRQKLMAVIMTRVLANRKCPRGANVAHPAQAQTVAQPMTGPGKFSLIQPMSYRWSKPEVPVIHQRKRVKPNMMAIGAIAPTKANRAAARRPRTGFNRNGVEFMASGPCDSECLLVE